MTTQLSGLRHRLLTPHTGAEIGGVDLSEVLPPVTRRKALFINYGFTRQIVGVSRRESEALLQFLFEHVNDPHFVCRFKWAPNSIAFWDNRCVQHYPTDDYFPATRTAERVTICGDRPFYQEG